MKRRINIFLGPSCDDDDAKGASADLISVWVAGKYSGIQGTGNVFDSVDCTFAPGIEVSMSYSTSISWVKHIFLATSNICSPVIWGWIQCRSGGAAHSCATLTRYLQTPDVESQSFMIEGDLRSRIGESLSNTIESAYQDEFASQADELSQWLQALDCESVSNSTTLSNVLYRP